MVVKMSDANRTVEEYRRLYAAKHHESEEQAKDAAVVKRFKELKEKEHDQLDISER